MSVLTGKTIAIIGYGNQGHAHALNLRDTIGAGPPLAGAAEGAGRSGTSSTPPWSPPLAGAAEGAGARPALPLPRILVAARPGSAAEAAARREGFDVTDAATAAEAADVIALMLPDERMSSIYSSQIEKGLAPGNVLLFAHGFAIRYGLIEPPDDVDVVMVAPKGPGTKLRSEYLAGRDLHSLISVHQDSSSHALSYALAYALGIGCARRGMMETTFAEETETDLFGEQAVLCGGMTELALAGFETLVEAGFEPEMAYFECVHELKLVVDLLNEGGFEHMCRRVSNTAEFGGYRAGRRVIGEASRDAMRGILAEIRDGSFADALIREVSPPESDFLERRRRETADLPVERTGNLIRETLN
jgi:ketol-acid reductoisomerase